MRLTCMKLCWLLLALALVAHAEHTKRDEDDDMDDDDFELDDEDIGEPHVPVDDEDTEDIGEPHVPVDDEDTETGEQNQKRAIETLDGNAIAGTADGYGPNLVRNGDFGDPLTDADWKASSCLAERVEDIDDGFLRWCVKVSNRVSKNAGVFQTVDLIEGKSYYFSAWVKIVTEGTTTFTTVAAVKLVTGRSKWMSTGKVPYMKPERGWIQVGGDFTVPAGGASAKFVLRSETFSEDYLLSNVSVTEIPSDPDWQQKAQDRIDQIRKQDLRIQLKCSGKDPADVEVEVKQVRHAFAFGTAIQAKRINGASASDLRYQEVFYDNFEWAVFENAMKWYIMEKAQFDINFERVDTALADLLAHNITVRGHCILWDFEDTSPSWLQPMTGPEVVEQVQRRCDYMLNHYGSDIRDWDVNNELLHGNYFVEKSNQQDVVSYVFKEAHTDNPSARLMLNDFCLISSGSWTMAMKSGAVSLLKEGAPVSAIGMQSHFTGDIDPHLVMHRLKILSEAGLPLFSTELDVRHDDEEGRARAYEIALTVLFSTAEVEGLLIWGFWDQAHWRPTAALFTGDDIQPNAAGRKWIELVQGTWRTNAVLRPTTGWQKFDMRAFQGEYDVTVKVKGEQVGGIRRYSVLKGEDTFWEVKV